MNQSSSLPTKSAQQDDSNPAFARRAGSENPALARRAGNGRRAGNARRAGVAMIAVVMAAFFAAMFPYVQNFTKHHPDERHYTDAAIQMVKSGDYLSPQTLNGELRLRKPILTYWLVAAGYSQFGISSMTSRLPFLILGTLCIPLTACLAYLISRNMIAAMIAGCAVAIQPALIISSMRSIPDIVLMFGLLVSAIGFARLMKSTKDDWFSIALAYLGLAFAIQSKGIHGVVFGFIMIGVFVMNRLQTNVDTKLGRHALGLVVCLLLSTTWFGLMYVRHGNELLLQFFGDQVTQRVNQSVLQIPFDFALVLLLLAGCSLPWSLALIERACQVQHGLNWTGTSFDLRAIAKAYPAQLAIGLWLVTYLLLASCVDRVNVRYQCPITPFLAIFIGTALAGLSIERLTLWFKRMSYSVSAAAIVSAVVLMGAAYCFDTLDRRLVIVCLISITVLIGSILFVPQRTQPSTPLLVGTLAILLSPALAYFAFDRFAYNKFESQVAMVLENASLKDATVTIMTNPADAARLNVATQGSLSVRYRGKAIDQLRTHRDDVPHDIMILGGFEGFHYDLAQFDVVNVKDGYWQLNFFDLVKATLRGKNRAYLDRHRMDMLVAIRKPDIILARKTQMETGRIKAIPVSAWTAPVVRSAIRPIGTDLNVYR
jgi:4-amino-4-deoxy-L-arabinose transferase-like glycosyltransferase